MPGGAYNDDRFLVEPAAGRYKGLPRSFHEFPLIREINVTAAHADAAGASPSARLAVIVKAL
jgi:hypothetical protein